MNNSFWGKVLDVLIDGKHLFFVFVVALSSFIIYYFGFVPQYNSYLVAFSVVFSFLFFGQLVISAIRWIVFKCKLNKIVDDPWCLKALYYLYESDDNSLNLDNLNDKVIALCNAGFIYKYREIPFKFSNSFEDLGHEFSSTYKITSSGKKYVERKIRK
jgi:hypothetical protein